MDAEHGQGGAGQGGAGQEDARQGGAGEGGAAAGGRSPGGAAGAKGTAGLLDDLARLRRRARSDRHGYWLPLLIFGVLSAGAAPLAVLATGRVPGRGIAVYSAVRSPGPILFSMLPLTPDSFYLGWYWVVALAAGYLLTVLWYRHRAQRAGVRTPARGYLITGLVLTTLAVVIPPLAQRAAWLWLLMLPLSYLSLRGSVAFLIIAAGLWVLARTERSRALAVIALMFTGTALLVSLYNVENVLFRLGWDPGSPSAWQLTPLPGVLLPAAVLLVSGAGTLLAQRRRGHG